MQRKTKYFLVLFALALLLINLHFWNVLNPLKYYNVTGDEEIEDNPERKKFDNLVEEDEATDDQPIYQDQEVTEEEIRLFGSLEEREVKNLRKPHNILSAKCILIHQYYCL